MTDEERPGKPSGARTPGKMDPAIQRQIGLRLREMYDGVLGDPIPDKFLELMKQLEDKDSNG